MTVHHCEAELHPDCTGIGVHRHHRRRRSQGGRDDAPNLLWLCAFCHTAVHADPAEAYRRGLLLRSWETPSDVPVRIDL